MGHPFADRTITICLLGFAGFFCYNELASLRKADVSIIPDHMELFLESSKTDQYRDGAHIIIARTNSQICPVTMLERYVIDWCKFRQIYFQGTVKDKGRLKTQGLRKPELLPREGVGT